MAEAVAKVTKEYAQTAVKDGSNREKESGLGLGRTHAQASQGEEGEYSQMALVNKVDDYTVGKEGRLLE
jgi:hypothetical protein